MAKWNDTCSFDKKKAIILLMCPIILIYICEEKIHTA